MSDAKITVKLRDLRTEPPSTREFVLPVARLVRTSSYFGRHLTESVSRHRDGTFRLNYPDFQLFEIYAEWLRSGEIFTKSGLRHLTSPDKRCSQRSPRDKARAAYTDYLGAWFLGSWVQDSVYKDSLMSLMIEKMNGVGGEGYPREFVRALKPGLVDILWMASKEGDCIRRFVFEVIKKWGEVGDLEGFVPGEGKEEYPKEFVRGLMVALFKEQREGREREDGEKTDVAATTTSAGYTEMSTTGFTTSALVPPPPFAIPMIGQFSFVSQASWPSTLSSPTTSSSGQMTASTTGAGSTATSISNTSIPRRKAKVRIEGWPRTAEEHCEFHEHTRDGRPCPLRSSTDPA